MSRPTASGRRRSPRRPGTCSVVPPHLLRALAEDGPPLAELARRTLAIDAALRSARLDNPPLVAPLPGPAVTEAAPDRAVSDAEGTTTVPGRLVRAEGDPPTGDASVDETYDDAGATWSLLWEVYGRDSLDGAGLRLEATVHYGQRYQNAFWDGTRMVIGDGDGEIFGRFSASVDVIAHELAHGLIERSAALVYQGQSGALNESVADVVGSLVRQRVLGQTAEEADWLIGADLLLPGVDGVALRSMAAPGTAYDDPRLGRDPQPATMSGYVETTSDNGGVHINSGIPNHAFYLAASALGGSAWERTGQVWYDTLTGGRLSAGASFADFAAATTGAAVERYGTGSAEETAVREAWAAVEVV